MVFTLQSLVAVAAAVALCSAQSVLQIQDANLTDVEANNFEILLNFERSNWAGGSVRGDTFYDVPDDFDPLNPPPPGTILKVEARTNTSLYTIAPTLALSRFLYTTETLNGTSIPASAYLLWPFTPRKFSKITCNSNGTVFPLIGMAHGTSGQNAECAPSHIRSLYGDFSEPFTLALNGYAVVVPDYAGLGVSGVPTPYFVFPSHANDLMHAINAAQSAFPSLSKEFVVMGQSQGGGVAWSYAQRQAQKPAAGYLGTVAVSPFTDLPANIMANDIGQRNGRVVGIAQGIDSVLPNFTASEWITPGGLGRYNLVKNTSACSTAGGNLFRTSGQILKDDWEKTASAQWYFNVSSNGKKPFAGPMLVLQGSIDANANVNVTRKAVDETCALLPNNSLEYIEYTGAAHVPTLYSSQHVWLDWIRDRFDGRRAQKGCSKETLTAATGVANGANMILVLERGMVGPAGSRRASRDSQSSLPISHAISMAYECDYGNCHRTFTTWHACEQHMDAKNHWVWTYECDTCSDRFFTERSAEQHMEAKDHYRYDYDCEHCNYAFRTREGRDGHEKEDHPYCEECDRYFDNAGNLRNHLNSKIHQGKKVRCPFCKADFTAASGVTHHLETSSCPKAPQLNRQVIHSELKQRDPRGVITGRYLEYNDSSLNPDWDPYTAWNGRYYECYVCHKGFDKAMSLRQHLDSPTHQSPLYHCPNKRGNCNKEFLTLGALLNHLESESCGYVKFATVRSNVNGFLSGGKQNLVKF
ncbi:Alpha/Beta hydrolase protein [Elsinoe ampelina]|uniref:Alpha/Beta hydrolase protein n=1 Tax=Elsinoe ampelina TaxID=302913 RepID=A0A6A6GBI6_9PEZI|nr:Alpha/Beta hydrolase protein [Elsinoe ampelina]